MENGTLPSTQNKFIVPVVLLVLGLVIGFVAGSYQGERQGAVMTEARLAPVLDLAFPKPPAEMFSLTGIVRGVYGATIQLEIDDLDDYLPHPDGSARAKETRNANVGSATAYTEIDFARVNASGDPARTSLTLADIKEGDAVTVRSTMNIRSAESFDVTAVERVTY